MSDRVAGRHVGVVGGGIAGLAAAAFLRAEAGPDLRVTVLEGAGSIGGKLRLIEVAGLSLDGGAEALLARRPEAVELVRQVGLGDDLVHPATTAAGVWTRGMVRPLPRGPVFGIPTDLRAAARGGVLSGRGLARAAAELGCYPRNRRLRGSSRWAATSGTGGGTRCSTDWWTR